MAGRGLPRPGRAGVATEGAAAAAAAAALPGLGRSHSYAGH